MEPSKVETSKNSITRKNFSCGIAVVGVLLAIAGVILKVMKVAPKKIYDLPVFIVCIGAGLVLYGIYQYMNADRLGSEIDFSPKVVRQYLLNNAIILALIIMMIIIAAIEPRFMQTRVLRDILAQSSTRLIIALGICFTLLIGGTDLSAGRMVGLAAVISASMMQTETYANRFFPNLPQVPIIFAIMAAVLACACFGALNGFLVSKLSLPPFIGTLAVQVMVYGAVSLYFDMPPNNSQPIGGIRADFSALGLYRIPMPFGWGEIPILIPIALFFTLLIWFILNKTIFGKNVYAIGGNRQAAVVSGINVSFTLMVIFVLAAVLYGVGGILEAARTSGANNNYGLGYELDAIAACVVGGVSLNGGVGKVSGIVIGVLIFTVIQYGLSFIGLNPYYQQVIKGVIIAVSVAIDMAKYGKK